MLLVSTPIAITSLLQAALWGGGIYIHEAPDGTITFTETQVNEDYRLFLGDRPPPPPSRVSLRTFPLLHSFDHLIRRASLSTGLPAPFIKAVCLAESGMNPNAVSSAGAQGLMQLMPGTAAELGVTDPFNPSQSIDGGSRYLATQLERFGSFRLALAAYNAGPHRVSQYGGIPPYRETQDYVEKVMGLWEHFRLTE